MASSSFLLYLTMLKAKAVCAEILGKRIRSCNKLGGFVFSCPEKPVKVIHYADEGILFS